MDLLWSPWRYQYVSTASDSSACFLCIGDSAEDPVNLVLFRGDHNFIIMNRYPYTSGHLMVAPYRHGGRLDLAGADQMAEMTSLARRAVQVLEDLYRPGGFNIGMNLGECAGAGVRDHLHLHVVPRWSGDVNFMTSTGETRVLPEDLETAYGKLKPRFES